MCKKIRQERIAEIVANAREVRKIPSVVNVNKFYYEIWIDRPMIAVKLWGYKKKDYGSKFSSEIGWSKVSRPDKWSEEFGLNVALGKAASKFVKSEQV